MEELIPEQSAYTVWEFEVSTNCCPQIEPSDYSMQWPLEHFLYQTVTTESKNANTFLAVMESQSRKASQQSPNTSQSSRSHI
jgi:hypothetical protein